MLRLRGAFCQTQAAAENAPKKVFEMVHKMHKNVRICSTIH